MSEKKQTTPDNEVTLHHVGDARVDQLCIFAHNEPGPGGAHHDYSICRRAEKPCHLSVQFQRGPVCEAGVNGVTNETLLAIVAHRLDGFQSGPMACAENLEALLATLAALAHLHDRTRRRLAAGVEGRGKP